MSSRNRNRILLPSEPKKGPSLLWGFALLFVAPPVSTFFGIYLLLKRAKAEYSHRQWQDFKHYAAIIGDRSSVSIRELSTRLGKSTDEVIRDLQAMIDREILDPQCYIDRGAMLLYLQDDVIETHFVNPTVNIYVNDADNARARSDAAEPARPVGKHAGKTVEKTADKPAEKPAERTRPQPSRKNTLDDEDFEAKLREIRQLNDDIDNEAVSERIDRIGALTASIFRVVREKPERADEVRKFMNYYLPTTLKLLKSYSLMEKQSYQGENIQASRRKIEEVLETLVHAFEQQQDKLFQSDALDVETDISVLETMMASDGLTEQGKLHL